MADSRATWDKLRKQAEEIVASRPEEIARLDPHDVHRVVQELHIQRIGSELQNEELMRVQEELEASRRRYARLFQDAPVGYVVLDGAGLILRSNDAFATMVQRPVDTLASSPFAVVLHPDDELVFRTRYAALFKHPGGKRMEVRFRAPANSQLFAQLEAQRGGDSDSRRAELLLTITDITDRKRFEDQLEEKSEHLAMTLDSIGDGVIATDKAGRVEWINPVAAELCGWPPAEAVHRPIEEVFHIVRGLDGEVAASPVRRVINEGNVVALANHTVLVSRSGTRHQIADSAAPIRRRGGDVDGAVLVFRDVTEDYRREQALAESEERFRRVVNLLPQLVSHIDRDLVYRYANRTYFEFFETEPEHVIGKRVVDVIGQEAFEKARSHIETVLAGTAVSYDLRLPYPTGERSIYGQLLPDKLPSGEVVGYYAVLTDLTALHESEADRERLRAQLLHAQKLESIGRLAGGVAHDFNNLLTGILGNVFLAQSQVEPDSALCEFLEEIESAGERAASLTRQLLAFSRKQLIRPEVVDPNALLGAMHRLLSRTIGEDVELRLVPRRDIGHIRVDPGQVEQAILNLVVNARDAMPSGGQLTIATEGVVLEETRSGEETIAAGPYLVFEVRDTGCGIEPETRARIFEPFFTTKPIGMGTGLGLSTTYGIVRQHDGYIECESTPGEGTVFRLFFPRVTEPVVDDASAGRVRLELPMGRETILVVEDEPAVKQVAIRALQRCGYRVLEAEDGVQALALLERERSPIDLLLTDMIMPQMGGAELAQRLEARMPALRVPYTSGYSDDLSAKVSATGSQTRFIAKPYTPIELARKVRAVLDE